MLCAVCGGANEEDHRFCIHCGTSLQASPSTPMPRRKPAAAVQESDGDPQQKYAIISVAAIVISFVVIFLLTGANPRAIPALLLLFLPIVPGELIFLLRTGKAVSRIKRFEVWVREKREINAVRSGNAPTWFLGPLFFCAAKAMQKTEGIENPYLRAGVIASGFLYITGFIAYVAVAIVAGIALH